MSECTLMRSLKTEKLKNVASSVQKAQVINYLFKMTEIYCPCFVVSRFKLTKKVKDQIRHGYFNCFAKKHFESTIV